MARRKYKTRTRYVKKYVRGRASKAGLTGAIKPVVNGLLTGVVQSFIPNDALGGYGDTLVPLAVGYFMHDKTLMTLGGYELGIKLAGGFTGAGSAGSSKGAY